MNTNDNPLLSCPVPLASEDRVQLAHGEGARLSRRFVRKELLAAFQNEFLTPLADGACLPAVEGRLVLTTDSSVVSPLFFPGGDIGKLAVHSAINDLAVCGAEPLYLSLALILEEGLALETVRCIIASIRDAASAAKVQVVTGDTKVVPRGACDQIFITTTGIGRLRTGVDVGAHRVRPGDQILVSGTLGDHGLAILAVREGLDLGEGLTSDTVAVHGLVEELLASGAEIHFMRDPTRGGLAAVLHELAEQNGYSILVQESSLPVSPAVRGASELLGIDPLFVANEGKIVVVVKREDAEHALSCMRRHPLGQLATRIGEVTSEIRPDVYVRTALGQLRIIDEPSGAPLPRIC